MSNLLDLMSKEDKAKALAKAAKRLESKPGATVSPELYITAEFGYYFGWEAILAIKRGYIEKIDELTGKVVLEPFTLEEVITLLEASKKVWYSKLVDNAHATMIATAAPHSKSPSSTFNGGMKPYIDRAKVE